MSLRLLATIAVALVIIRVADAAIAADGNYLIEQREAANGLEVFSPYVLWNDHINEESAELQSPVAIRSVNGRLDVELTVEQFRFRSLFSFNTRAFCYDGKCSVPGPTLYCRAGDTIRITLRNQLRNDSLVNRTNVYIQGLNLDTQLNNPYRSADGNGGFLRYLYQIPESTSPGVSWYYSRVQGVSALHVMGGLHGAIVVEHKRPETELLKALRDMRRQLLVFSHIMIAKDSKVIDGVANNSFSLVDEDYATSSLTYSYLSKEYGSNIPTSIEFNETNNITDAWFTNGQYQPTHVVQPGEWILYDLVAASGDKILEVELRDAVGMNKGSFSCDVRLVALDGKYLEATRNNTRAVRHLVLYQSSRATIAVKCSTPGSYFLQSATRLERGDQYFGIGDYQTKTNQNLMIIKVQGATLNMLEPPIDLSSMLTAADGLDMSAPTVKWSIAAAQSSSIITLYNKCNSSNCDGFGVGTNCQLACYDRVSCQCIYGSTYGVVNFPTALSNQCVYQHFNGVQYRAINDSSKDCERVTQIDSFFEKINDNETFVAEYQCQSLASAAVRSVSLGQLQEIQVFGSRDLPIPIVIQGSNFEIVSFENVESSENITNVMISKNPRYNSSIDYSLIASVGELRDVIPLMPGKLTIRGYFSGSTGNRLLQTSFLKFADKGLIQSLGVIEYVPEVIDPVVSIDPIPTPVVNVGITVPRSAIINPSSAADIYLCNATGSSFYYEEKLDLAKRIRIISTDSCPNHYSQCQNEECGGSTITRALRQRRVIHVPLYPGIAVELTDTTCSRSLLGVAVNGVGIYGRANGITSNCLSSVSDFTNEVIGRTSCERNGKYDAIKFCGDIVNGPKNNSFDKCGGFNDDDGTYKYHLPPVCLLDQLSDTQISGHSPQIGWALDGFPIFGPLGPKGILMIPCGREGAHPKLCLDPCNGYYGELPGYDKFFYRYYVAGEAATGACSSKVVNNGNCTRNESPCCLSNTPSSKITPYSIGCYRGCPLSDVGCRIGTKRGLATDYLPQLAIAPTEVYDKIVSTPETIPEPSIPTAVPQQMIAGTKKSRKIAFRNPFDNIMTIVDFNSTSKSVSVEGLPRSSNDAFITGMDIDTDFQIIYYATQSGIYAYHEDTKVDVLVIAGLLEVTLHGFNLGKTLEDINFIKVNGIPCTSIVHLSSELVKCISYQAGAVGDSITADMIHVSTIGGNTRGIYPEPTSIARSGSGRPILSAVDLDMKTFLPYSIKLVSDYFNGTVLKTLYWTNVGLNSYSIQRSSVDGRNIQTVVNSVQKGFGIDVATVFVDETLAFQSFDNSSATASNCNYDQILSEQSSHTASFLPSKSCIGLAHTIIYVDASKGTLAKITVPPISSNVVFWSVNDTLLPISAYYVQEISRLTTDVVEALVMVRGLQNPRGVHIDISARSVYVAIFDGLVFKADLLALLNDTMRLSSFSQYSDGESTPLFDQLPSPASATTEIEQLDGGNGVALVNTTSGTNDSNIVVSATNSNFSNFDGVLFVDLLQVLRMGQASQSILPSWFELHLVTSNTAKLNGIASLPISVGGVDEWLQQRIFTINTNENKLVITTDKGFAIEAIDMSSKFGANDIFWPSTIKAVNTAIQIGNSTSSSIYNIYISEFLGKIWKLQLLRDESTGLFEINDLTTPTAVVDKSKFPASIRYRQLFTEAKAAGLASLEKIFFSVY